MTHSSKNGPLTSIISLPGNASKGLPSIIIVLVLLSMTALSTTARRVMAILVLLFLSGSEILSLNSEKSCRGLTILPRNSNKEKRSRTPFWML